jgi:outer membrane lipoprotein carrier protein
MVRNVLSVLLTGVVLAATAVPACSQDSAQEILEKVRQKYESITDAEIRFAQKVKFSLSKAGETTSGTLLIKKGHKYRVETGTQTIVTDGVTVWSYTPALKQVLVDRFKEDERSLTPEHLLLGTSGGYVPILIGKARLGKTETTLLKLTPQDEQSLVSEIRLWVDEEDWTVRQVEVLDVNGKQITYTVEQLRLNIGVPDSRFTFQAPEGVEVVDLR